MKYRSRPRAADRDSRDRRARALEIFERRLARTNVVPDAGNLVTRRFAGMFQALTAIALGIVAGNGSILFNFILFNQVLHL